MRSANSQLHNKIKRIVMFKRNIETLMVPPKKIKSKINQKIVKVTSKSIGILIFITIIINVPRRFIMANWNIIVNDINNFTMNN